MSLKSPCLTPGCPERVDRGHCAAHGGSENPKRIYGSKRWKVLRARILADRPWCEECQTEPATQVDHVTPLSQGGAPFDAANLRAVCRPCHGRKSFDEMRESTGYEGRVGPKPVYPNPTITGR